MLFLSIVRWVLLIVWMVNLVSSNVVLVLIWMMFVVCGSGLRFVCVGVIMGSLVCVSRFRLVWFVCLWVSSMVFVLSSMLVLFYIFGLMMSIWLFCLSCM